MEDKKERLNDIFRILQETGKVATKKEFASALGINYTCLISALNGEERYLTKPLLSKATALLADTPAPAATTDLLKVIPTSARGGTLCGFADAVMDHDCERMISPIKGADYAIQVTGDSMAPEYPSGSQVIIKKVDESAFIEWGKVYVLDTDNGAVIKRINATENPEEVECVSINPEFGKFRVKKEFIRGWYRVLMCLSLK